MGLFSSEERTYVGTSISRMNKVLNYIPSSTVAVIRSLVRETAMGSSIVSELVNGIGGKAESFYRSAKRAYSLGLPKGAIATYYGVNESIGTAIDAYLTTLEGAVTIQYAFYGPPNYFHYAWQHIHAEYDYRPNTKELVNLSAIKGYTVTLDKVELITSSTFMASVNIACFYSLGLEGDIAEDLNRTTVGCRIYYSWKTPGELPESDPIIHTDTEIVTEDVRPAGIDTNSEYYLVSYKVDTTQQYKFFNYLVGSGVASLDSPTQFEYDGNGSYFPWLYFRHNYVRPVETDATYGESRRLARKLGLDYADIVENVHVTTEDVGLPPEQQRPAADLDKLVSSFLYMCVPADATTQLELKYLYSFFEKHFTQSGGVVVSQNLTDFNNSFTTAHINEAVAVIRDARMTMTIGNKGLFKRYVTGSIGAVGTYGMAKGEMSVTARIGGKDYTLEYPVTWHVYRYQTSANQYIEYEVVHLVASYQVLGDQYSVSQYTSNLEDPTDTVMIPLDRAITKDWKPYEREEIYYYSMHIVNNSLVRVTLQWYETGIWQGFFKAVAFAAMVYGAVELGLTLNALITIGGASMVFAMELAWGQFIQIFGPMLLAAVASKHVSPELAALLALLAFLYGWQSSSPSSFTSLSKVMLTSAVKGAEMRMQRIQQDTLDITADYEAKSDALQELIDDLENPNALDTVMRTESPDAFYNRVLQRNNVSSRLSDAVTYYADIALALPKT